MVHLEGEEGEGGVDEGGDVRVEVDGEEVEGDILRARRVLQNRQHRGHGPAYVVGVEGHHDVDCIGAACGPVAEGRGLPERGDDGRGQLRDMDADGGRGVGADEEEEEDRQEAGM